MHEFPTQFHAHERFFANPGNPVKTLFVPKFDDNGHMELSESGQEDTYAFIQSFKDSVDIHVLLKRYANGETDVLSKIQTAYGDFTSIPTSYAELLNSVIAGKNFFQSLPLETRANFNHSFEQFMVSMDKDDFLIRMGKEPEIVPPVETPKEVTA